MGRKAQRNDYTILIVDDDLELIQVEGKVLGNIGYDVVTVTTGAKALEVIVNRHIDIVILDLKLPDMDGEVVLRKMKQLRPGTKIIIMTGFGDVESYLHTLQKGVIDYLIKPVSPKGLAKVIEKSLSLS